MYCVCVFVYHKSKLEKSNSTMFHSYQRLNFLLLRLATFSFVHEYILVWDS